MNKNDIKHSAIKASCCEDEECCDDCDCDDSRLDIDDLDQYMMPDFMISMVEAAGHQMSLANDLTKTVVGKSTKEMSAEAIFTIFKQAAAVVADASPLKGLMQNLPTK